MSVSFGNGVDLGNLVTATTNPLTGGIELLANGAAVEINADRKNILATPEGTVGTMGTLVQNWSSAGTAAGTASKISYNRADATNLLSMCPDKACQNTIRIQGNGGGTAVTWTAPLSTGFIDSSARNLGVWARAMPRADGQKYSIARMIVGRDNAGSIDTTVAFGDWIFRLPTDGKWRFYTLTCTATAGYFKSSPSPATFFPGSGATLAQARVYAPVTAECYELSPLQSTDYIEFGGIYINPKGGKSCAIVRFDDNKQRARQPFGTAWTTQFPSGFAGISGVSISAADGAAMSAIDLTEAFGFRGTHYILCRHIGQQSGFMSLAELLDLKRRGHQIAFQSYFNPVSSNQLGVRLLGPAGRSIGNTGTITSVVSTVVTQAGHVVGEGTTRSDSVGGQGFPVVFGAAGLNANLVAGTTYWLRYLSASTFSVHATEFDARDNLRPIDLTGCTPASMSYTYAGSTADYSGILADYQAGKAFFEANGLGDGYKYYALNQSAHDRYTVQAMDAFGEFEKAFGGSAADDAMGFPHAESPHTRYTLDDRMPSIYMYCENSLGTDDLTTEAAVRKYVRMCVQEGAIIQNTGHDQHAAMFTWYLDELKYWSDAGMVYVGTHEQIVKASIPLF